MANLKNAGLADFDIIALSQKIQRQEEVPPPSPMQRAGDSRGWGWQWYRKGWVGLLSGSCMNKNT